MTRIEKAVKIVSDLYDFYRKIPKVPNHTPVRDEKRNQALPRTVRESVVLHSSESPSARRR
jgi:hypothetical protein